MEDGQWPLSRLFFGWWLLGLIPGGAPFSQLNKGVKDAKVESTGLVVRQFMTKTCRKAIKTNNNNLHKVTECREKPSTETAGKQKRALVKSHGQHLRRSNKEAT